MPFDLPPVAEQLQHALLNPPPGLRLEFEAPSGPVLTEFFAKYEPMVESVFALVDTNLRDIRQGVDRIPQLYAHLPAARATHLVEELIVLADGAIMNDKDTLQQLKASRERALKAARVGGVAPRVKRLFARLAEAATRHHDGVVELQYRLRALAAQFDPEAKKVVFKPLAARSAADWLQATLDV